MLNRIFSGKDGKVKYPLLISGAAVYGIALGFIISPNELAPGGIAGLSVMLSKFLPLGVGSLTMILNIPLLIISFKVFGRNFLARTIIAIAVSGAAADICALFPSLTADPILGAVFGGALLALGCGTVFRSGGTTGGTDIAAKLIKRKKPYLGTGEIFLLIDGTVCILSGIVFQSFDNALYSFITLFVFSRMLDMVLYGGDFAKLALIISEKSREIQIKLLESANVGCTVLKGKTGYGGKDAEVILCAVKKRKLPEVRKIVAAEDENAFVLVSDANEIIGKGFKSPKSESF